jgi:hypothetical protein
MLQIIGSPITKEAVAVAGNDSNNIVRTLRTDSNGDLIISASASNIPTVDAADGTPGATAPLFAIQVAGVNPSGNLTVLSTTNAGYLNVAGTVTSTPSASSTASAPAQTTVTSTSSQILASNVNRKECTIVNTGTVVVYLALGQTPTNSAYHIALSPCTTANDGTGGVYISDIWVGAINAITASTSGTVCVTELT